MYPVLVSTAGFAIGFGASHTAGLSLPTDASNLVAVASAIGSVSATMLGFVLAACAVVASVSNVQFVQNLMRTRLYRDLLATLVVAAATFLLCAASGYAMLFGLRPSGWITSVVVGLHAAALFCLLDVGRKFLLLLKNIVPPSKDPYDFGEH